MIISTKTVVAPEYDHDFQNWSRDLSSKRLIAYTTHMAGIWRYDGIDWPKIKQISSLGSYQMNIKQ